MLIAQNVKGLGPVRYRTKNFIQRIPGRLLKNWYYLTGKFSPQEAHSQTYINTEKASLISGFKPSAVPQQE